MAKVYKYTTVKKYCRKVQPSE